MLRRILDLAVALLTRVLEAADILSAWILGGQDALDALFELLDADENERFA